jgi:hypothetical protein
MNILIVVAAAVALLLALDLWTAPKPAEKSPANLKDRRPVV